MKVYYYDNTYGPSKELKFRLRKLAQIAAIAKLCNQMDLYNQAKEHHDSLVTQYNSVAKTKEKGFWGKFLDNLTNTTTSVIMANYLDKDTDYETALITYTHMKEIRPEFMPTALKTALEEWERGFDISSRFD